MTKRLIFKVLGAALTLGIALPLILFFLVYNGFFGKVPGEEEIINIENLEASIVYDTKGESLGKFYIQDRTLVGRYR